MSYGFDSELLHTLTAALRVMACTWCWDHDCLSMHPTAWLDSRCIGMKRHKQNHHLSNEPYGTDSELLHTLTDALCCKMHAAALRCSYHINSNNPPGWHEETQTKSPSFE
jgi:hypothetical protein